ncbi:hypothetical protein HK096_009225 [Nowakowskiella sp. JEL0078]|nr:hypothetical protein HK096_009225 [Nowakowskiella sp. JEL0078]
MGFGDLFRSNSNKESKPLSYEKNYKRSVSRTFSFQNMRPKTPIESSPTSPLSPTPDRADSEYELKKEHLFDIQSSAEFVPEKSIVGDGFADELMLSLESIVFDSLKSPEKEEVESPLVVKNNSKSPKDENIIDENLRLGILDRLQKDKDSNQPIKESPSDRVARRVRAYRAGSVDEYEKKLNVTKKTSRENSRGRVPHSPNDKQNISNLPLNRSGSVSSFQANSDSRSSSRAGLRVAHRKVEKVESESSGTESASDADKLVSESVTQVKQIHRKISQTSSGSSGSKRDIRSRGNSHSKQKTPPHHRRPPSSNPSPNRPETPSKSSFEILSSSKQSQIRDPTQKPSLEGHSKRSFEAQSKRSFEMQTKRSFEVQQKFNNDSNLHRSQSASNAVRSKRVQQTETTRQKPNSDSDSQSLKLNSSKIQTDPTPKQQKTPVFPWAGTMPSASAEVYTRQYLYSYFYSMATQCMNGAGGVSESDIATFANLSIEDRETYLNTLTVKWMNEYLAKMNPALVAKLQA